MCVRSIVLMRVCMGAIRDRRPGHSDCQWSSLWGGGGLCSALRQLRSQTSTLGGGCDLFLAFPTGAHQEPEGPDGKSVKKHGAGRVDECL